MEQQSLGHTAMDNQPLPPRPSKASNTVLSSRYSLATPGPPTIFVPVSNQKGSNVELVPCFEMADFTHLTREQIAIITGNRPQVAKDTFSKWEYEHRRQAQSVLDFLYIGPTSCVRDQDFLQREGITMLIVARDARMASLNILSVDRAAQALDIPAHYVNLKHPQQLISEFDHIFNLINSHILQAYNNTSQEGGPKGKVLVTCETGNDKAATIAAAYIMALYGKDMVTAVQFVGYRRFCSAINDEMKQILRSWEEILRARYSVLQAKPFDGAVSLVSRGKRRLDDAMSVDDEDDPQSTDLDRFSGRQPFVPFKERQ